MDIFNMEHYRDTTAAIAIARVDRVTDDKAQRLQRLTYTISEIVKLRCIRGQIVMLAAGLPDCYVHIGQ